VHQFETIIPSFDPTLDVRLDQALQPMRRVSSPTGRLDPVGSPVPGFVPMLQFLRPTEPPFRLLRHLPDPPVRARSAAPTWQYGRRSANLIYPPSPAAREHVMPRFVRAQIPTVDSMVTGLGDNELARTSRALKASNISRLIRIVRDWNSPPRPVVAERRPVSEAAHFRAQILAADHRLLERSREKDLWFWFLDWREDALSAEDSELSAAGLLRLLRRTLSRLRVGRRPASPGHRPPAGGDRLRRLADIIVGHAPPASSPPSRSRRTEAG
jgi:hypothetical protein